MTKNDKVKNIIYQAVEDSFVNQTRLDPSRPVSTRSIRGGLSRDLVRVISEKKVRQFTKIFADLHSADAISYLQIYLHGLRKYIEKQTLVIESPISLSVADQSVIRENLGQKYSIMGSSVKIDTSLLGGLRIKIGDVILDDSVKSRINQLGEAIRN